ncbi:MAG: hypothetical protein JNK64_04350 [Myxococcales bacterium]|nr:hypothetical protein [Myxococcales bacterium]
MTGAVGVAAAAVLAEAAHRSRTDGWRRFLAVPAALTPLDLDDLIVAEPPGLAPSDPAAAATLAAIGANQLALAALVDRVIQPSEVAAHATAGGDRFLWDVLEPVCAGARIAPGDAGDAVARRFAAVATAQAAARRFVDGVTLWQTAVIAPPLTRDATWARVRLPASVAVASARELPPYLATWLARRDLLATGEAELRHVDVELAEVALRRDWFDAELLTSAGWSWPGAALSDGGAPARGALPARVVALVLIRRAVLALDPDRGAASTGRAPWAGPTLSLAVLARLRARWRRGAVRRGFDHGRPGAPAAPLVDPHDDDLGQLANQVLPFAWHRVDAPWLLEGIDRDTAERQADLAIAQARRDQAEARAATAQAAAAAARRRQASLERGGAAALALRSSELAQARRASAEAETAARAAVAEVSTATQRVDELARAVAMLAEVHASAQALLPAGDPPERCYVLACVCEALGASPVG